MNINVQRTIDRIVGTALCRIFSLLPRRKPVNGEKKRILIILLSEMGSLVLAYPMFARLKQQHPNSTLHVLMFKKNREVLELLDVMPKENIITLDDASLIRFAFDCFKAIRTMRSLRLDAVIDCELFARVSSLFAFLSGAKTMVGFHPYTQEGLYRGSFINRPVMYNPYHAIPHQVLSLAEALDSDSTPCGKRAVKDDLFDLPPIRFDSAETAAMWQRVQHDFPAISNKPLILIYPSGGILPIRAWPQAHYRALVEQLLDADYAVAIIGMESDKAQATELQAQCNSESCIDLTGYTRSVRELLLLFHSAALLITNDGGPGQFAALTPIPSIILFGPETPTLYGSLGENSYFFYSSLSCSPCLTAYNHRNSPCDGDNRCLKMISPQQVYTKALEMLGSPKSSTDS